MKTFRTGFAVASLLMAFGPSPMLAADINTTMPPPVSLRQVTPLRVPPVWFYDGRSDDGDFPNGGFFPGDFASDPANATFGAAGLFGEGRSIDVRDTAPLEVRRHMHRRDACLATRSAGHDHRKSARHPC